MEIEKIVVGLDIGTTKIVAIVGRQNVYGKLDILGMGKAVSEGVTGGVVINIDKTVDAIRQAIAEAESQSGISIGEVNVGIAGKHIKSSKHHGSMMRPNGDNEITVADINRLTDDMYKIVVPPGNQIIHVMPQVYSIDNAMDGIKDPVGMTGTKLEADFHVITAQITAIQNINKCVKKAGLDIVNLILEPLASSMSVLSEEEKEAGVVLVDIGGGTTDVAVFHDGIIRHTAVIPFGGNIITSDITQGCMVMQKNAEQLKTNFGRAIADEANPNEIVSIPGLRGRPAKEISVKNLAHIIQARMEEIIEFVNIEIAQSGYNKQLAAGVVVTGGGSQLQHLSQLFEYMTGLDARIGYPNEHLGKSVVEAVKSPMYATGVGLVLAGFQALDDRENKYHEKAEAYQFVQNEKAPKTIAIKASGLNVNGLMKGILERTKGLLIDDLDDKVNYKSSK